MLKMWIDDMQIAFHNHLLNKLRSLEIINYTFRLHYSDYFYLKPARKSVAAPKIYFKIY